MSTHRVLYRSLQAQPKQGSLLDRVRQRIRSLFGEDLGSLIRACSPFVVSGSTEEMCEQLVGL